MTLPRPTPSALLFLLAGALIYGKPAFQIDPRHEAPAASQSPAHLGSPVHAPELKESSHQAGFESSLPVVHLSTINASAAESQNSAAGVVFFRDSDAPTESTLAITFSVAGSAASDGSDYDFSSAAPLGYDPATARGSIVLLPGEMSATLTLTPFDDVVAEGTEIVQLTIQPSATYSPGAANSATLTIADNDAPDYFSELFTAAKPFDLAGRRLTLTPLNIGGYRANIDAASAFTTRSDGAIPLVANGAAQRPVNGGDLDDGYWRINAAAASPRVFDVSYDQLYIGTNGFVTFGSGDVTSAGSLPAQFQNGQPRISAYWRDLDPTAGGQISYLSVTTPGAERLVVTWQNVPLFASPSRCVSMQLELWRNGVITLTWLGTCAAADAIVGISPGLGQPSPFFESDLSRYAAQADQAGITSWRAAKFEPAQLFDPSQSGENADPDHDGLCNLVEYAFGRDPRTTDATPISQTGFIAQNGFTYLTLTFSRARNTFDASVQTQFSGDLVNWTDTGIAVGSPIDLGDEREQVTIRDIVPLTLGSSRFGRVHVETP
jgi:hypothetical protein